MTASDGIVTPMMAQYLEIKGRYPDALLFYRMGDFYEMFFDDAEAAAAALDIALTKRGQHLGQDIPMCGVPVHAAEGYLLTLIRKGFRVAIAEQMEDPAEARKRGAKSVVRREVVRLVTPGTLTEDALLPARQGQALAAIALGAGGAEAAIAVCELAQRTQARLSAEALDESGIAAHRDGGHASPAGAGRPSTVPGGQRFARRHDRGDEKFRRLRPACATAAWRPSSSSGSTQRGRRLRLRTRRPGKRQAERSIDAAAEHHPPAFPVGKDVDAVCGGDGSRNDGDKQRRLRYPERRLSAPSPGLPVIRARLDGAFHLH